MPLRFIKPGNKFSFSISTNVSLPLQYNNKAATTASSSNGFILHVEYTILPPLFNINADAFAICNCIKCNSKLTLGRNNLHKCENLRNVPSPEHGTSATILSNLNFPFILLYKSSALEQFIKRFGLPHLEYLINVNKIM